MASELLPAIEALEKKLSALEMQANGIRSAINVLCETGGLTERYPNVGAPSHQAREVSLSRIGSDTFYGKKQSTAIRQYLELRKAAGGHGPATPREIFDALKAGGMQFEAKSDEVALVGLRALLRKNTATFHKLPNGTYGLLSWYPDARRPRPPLGEGMIGKADSTDPDTHNNADDADDNEIDHAYVA